jgi:hypothetical protein
MAEPAGHEPEALNSQVNFAAGRPIWHRPMAAAGGAVAGD